MAGDRSRAVCLEVPRPAPCQGAVAEHTYRMNPTNVFHHHNAVRAEELSHLQLGHFLLAEARVIERTGEHWNHQVIGVARWNPDGDLEKLQAPDSEADALLARHPRRFALVMPRWFSSSLSALPQAERRRQFQRLLPALCTALQASPHGDLKPDAIHLDPTGRFLRLLDPGARIEDPDGALDWHWGEERSLLFTSNTDYYPVLVPQHGPGHLEAHTASLKELVSQQSEAMRLRLQLKLPSLEPSDPSRGAADMFALGLIYLEILTDRRLKDHVTFPWPLWNQGESDRGPSQHAKTFAALDAGWPGQAPADAPNISAEEDQLCLDLLLLQYRPA